MHKQPRALLPLFLTELWERFGFYVIEGLLIIFLTSELHFSDTRSFEILGAFTALAYISPAIGGFIADRVIGYRYAVLSGGILLFCGYALMSVQSENILFWGLATVVMGNGLLKANVSSFLGNFYQQYDPRRDAGFTIFYMGINLGVILSTLSSGYIQRYCGWPITFGTAALGMLISIGSFIWGFSRFKEQGLPPQKDTLIPAKHSVALLSFLSAMVVIGCIIGSYFLIENEHLANIILGTAGIILIAGLVTIAFRYPSFERNRFLALIILILISILFWGLFFQEFFVVNLFVKRNVDRHLFNFDLPNTVFISLESFFILVLAPFFAQLWIHLYGSKFNPSTPLKFAFAMFGISLCFGTLVLSSHFTNAQGYTPAYWMVIYFFFFTVGELFLSPIGLSMVTELAPPRLTGLMMGVWFMALGFGGSLAGFLAQQASIPKGVTDLAVTNVIYHRAFLHYSFMALIFGVILVLISPLLSRMIRA